MGSLSRATPGMRPALGGRLSLLVCLSLLAGVSVASGAQQRAPSYEPLIGARLGSAQHQSVYLGVARMSNASATDHSGQTIEFEYGRSGGQVAIGQMTAVPMAPEFRLQSTLLRTWGRATRIAPKQTYVGVELQATILIGVSVGAYRRIRGDAPGDAHFYSLRYVLGF